MLNALLLTLHTLHIWPGLVFPAQCPNGYKTVLDQELKEMLPEDRPLMECVLKDHHFVIRRSGKLIASVEAELAPLEGGVCTESKLRLKFDGKKAMAKIDFTGAHRSQILMTTSLDAETSAVMTCSKAQGLIDRLSLEVLTPYSLLGNKGKPLPGKIAKQEVVREPYAVPENMKALTTRFGPLAKKLFADNIAWNKDPMRIARRNKPKTMIATSSPTAAKTEAAKPAKGAPPQAKCTLECLDKFAEADKDDPCAKTLSDREAIKANSPELKKCMGELQSRATERMKNCKTQCPN